MKTNALLTTTIFLLALLSAASPADEQLDKSLNDQYRDKTLYLRHCFTSDSQEYDANGQLLKGGEEGTWTLYGRMVVGKISIERDAVKVEGNRVSYVFDKDAKRMMPFRERTSVKIKLRLTAPVISADQANAVLGRVFALTKEDIVNSAPPYWQEFLKEQLNPAGPSDSVPSAGNVVKPPPSQVVTENGVEKVFTLGDPGVTPPKILFKLEPEFTEPARKHGVQGVVGLNVVVDGTGRISDVRIVHAVGMGLDESAVETIKKWRFSPAAKDGVPVAIAVYVEVDYYLGQRR